MADSAYARFIFDDSVVRADGSVRWKAFLDKRPPHETSVNSHSVIGKGIHWDEGTRVNPSRSLLGAADLSCDSIKATGLKVRLVPAGQLPHHAEIYAWPQGDTEDTKQQRIALATDLADASTYFPQKGGARCPQ